ncbi:hypothetical protein A3Q34_19780 [Colwellia sp. PAMC 20917]|uniref:response regulator n=1 Tax=unclassified Colwellia TaxID=196834 RepID=UPI000877F982|nr:MULTISPECIES: response regulator [unclassified Colwellia]AOW78885.1 hypothetical protein A3Q34_19780 [Colwellia sp. PAMC 20917]MBA6349828.1 response regulator [Colwellia sp. BRX8-9]
MKKLVYFLDDEIFLGEIFQEYFETENIDIGVFNHPKEAIEACISNPPDIMLIDYRLPEMTGLEVAQFIDDKIIKILMTGDFVVPVNDLFKLTINKPYKLEDLKSIILGEDIYN